MKPPLHVSFPAIVLLCFSLSKVLTYSARKFDLLPRIHSSLANDELLMLFAGIAEAVAVALIFWFLPAKRSSQLIALFGLTFLAYRLSINPTYCPCLGAAPTLIPWLKVNEHVILVAVPIGFLALGLWGWARETAPARLKPEKS